jgi:signal transduction histidine kinase
MKANRADDKERPHRKQGKEIPNREVRGIAHDLNNILATISLYSELLQQEPMISQEFQERLKTICQQAKDGTNLVQRLRSLTKS